MSWTPFIRLHQVLLQSILKLPENASSRKCSITTGKRQKTSKLYHTFARTSPCHARFVILHCPPVPCCTCPEPCCTNTTITTKPHELLNLVKPLKQMMAFKPMLFAQACFAKTSHQQRPHGEPEGCDENTTPGGILQHRVAHPFVWMNPNCTSPHPTVFSLCRPGSVGFTLSQYQGADHLRIPNVHKALELVQLGNHDHPGPCCCALCTSLLLLKLGVGELILSKRIKQIAARVSLGHTSSECVSHVIESTLNGKQLILMEHSANNNLVECKTVVISNNYSQGSFSARHT